MSKQFTSSKQRALTFVGTMYYLAPEVWKWEAYSYEADIWALGVVLYELCTGGRYPFDPPDCNENTMAKMVIRGEYPPIPDYYSTALKKLVEGMLKKNPKDRPAIDTIIKGHPLLKE